MSTYLSRIADDVAEMRQAMAVRDPATAGVGWLVRMHRKITDLLKFMVQEHRSRSKVFGAVLAGMIIGTTPLFGLHLLICIVVAMSFRLNKFLVYLAANISVPPMIPVLAFLSIQTAYIAVHQVPMAMDYDTLYQHRFDFILYWALGAIPVGCLLGLIFGGISVLMMSQFRKGADSAIATKTPGKLRSSTDEFERKFKKMTADLHRAFLPTGKIAAGFARGKSAGDPVYRMVVQLAEGARHFLDIGGGQGLLSLLVAGFYPGLNADVADYDERKLKSGAQAAKVLNLKNIRFRNEDVFAGSTLPDCDLIACIDVLHYQPVEQQRALVEKMARALPAGGRLVIRDMNADHRLRTFFTVLQERFSLLFSLTIASRICPRSGRDLVAQLESHGMSVEARKAWGVTPFSNTLFVAKKN